MSRHVTRNLLIFCAAFACASGAGFAALKLTGLVDWSWGMTLAPVWVPGVIFWIAVVVIWFFPSPQRAPVGPRPVHSPQRKASSES